MRLKHTVRHYPNLTRPRRSSLLRRFRPTVVYCDEINEHIVEWNYRFYLRLATNRFIVVDATPNPEGALIRLLSQHVASEIDAQILSEFVDVKWEVYE